jgi:hypothetical protein
MVKICHFSWRADYATISDGIYFAVGISEDRQSMSLVLLTSYTLRQHNALAVTSADTGGQREHLKLFLKIDEM